MLLGDVMLPLVIFSSAYFLLFTAVRSREHEGGARRRTQ
jgi:hypothetical protein